MVDENIPKPRYAENLLFAVLGMLCSVVVSLATFQVIDNRSPASIEGPVTQENDFDARVYIHP